MAKLILQTEISPHQLGTQTAEKGRYLFSTMQLENFAIELPEKLINKATFIE